MRKENFIYKNHRNSNLSNKNSQDGRKELIEFDKIKSRIVNLCFGLNMDFIDPVIKQLFSFTTFYR